MCSKIWEPLIYNIWWLGEEMYKCYYLGESSPKSKQNGYRIFYDTVFIISN